MARKSYTVQPILKALRLLEAVGWKGHDVKLTEIARELGLPKTTAFRYLQTLAFAGFIRHDAEKDRYGVGPRIRMFAEAEKSLWRLRRIAVPEMEAVARTYNETVNLAMSSGFDVVYVEIVRGDRMLRMQARIGEHHPLHSTALGKAILAFLPSAERTAILDSPLGEMTARTIRSSAMLRRQLSEAQRRGYSLEREETEDGISCIGVPILDREGYPLAALSLAAPDRRLMSILDLASRSLEGAAQTISARLEA
jgi:IclR family transcriptional regulator, KDG regulon repressor